jgi:hypothetical protein
MSSSFLPPVSQAFALQARKKRPGLYIYTLAPYLVSRCANGQVRMPAGVPRALAAWLKALGICRLHFLVGPDAAR